MATSEVKNEDCTEAAAGTNGFAASTCDARDLKRIVTHLADQIADADRRHTEALMTMQERLGMLGTAAQGMREQLPLEKTKVLDRIEGSMADLSSRIADADAKRRAAQANSVPSAEAAPALRSALAAGALDAFSRRTHSARNTAAEAEAVDNFDVVDSAYQHREDDLIDRDAADALARLYEAGVTDPSGTPPLDAVTASARYAPAETARDEAGEVAFSPAPPATRFQNAAEDARPAAMSQEADRIWLEERFSEVASKLEQSLSGMRGEDQLDAIEARFNTLESRLTSAMSEATKTSDLVTLKGIESQVEDLNAQLVAVQTHFSRLDTIELELRSLAERMSSEELVKLMQGSASNQSDPDALSGAVANGMAQQFPRIEETLQAIASQLSADKIATLVAQARPAGPDAGSLARLIADEVAERMPASAGQHSDPSDRLDELKMTLDAFVAERRHGDEQMNTMLDTMQQAMIRLLDRMDAIENVGYEPADGEHDSRGYDADYSEPLPAAVPASMQHQPQLQPHALAPHRQEFEAPDPMPCERAPGPQAAIPPALEPRPAASPISAANLRAAVQPVPVGIAAEAAAVPSSDPRESYIAAARRAARMAAEAPPELEVSAEAPLSTTGLQSPAEPKGPKRGLSTVSMALICLILVGASFVAVKSTILAPKSPQPAAQSQAPQATPPRTEADKRIQNLEDADGNVDGRTQRSGDPQRRSSIEGEPGSDRGLTGQPANGGTMPQMQGAQTVPAALTNEPSVGIAQPRSNELPPLSIGPNSLRTAAAKGDPSAEFEVGARFAEGRGVQQDLQQAVNWYQRAAAQGYAPAQYRLGSMFERGLGVKTDLARARVWYQRAAEQGIVKAMHNLAVLTAGRDSAMTDYATAGKWFRSAADYGLTDSQFNLAIMHDSGLGMERDAKQAFKWFSLAARSGDDEAARRRESLRQKLQPQEVAEVEAELSNWRPKPAEQTVNDPRLAGEAWKSRTR